MACTATHRVFYVLPNNSTNTSCPFESCATLSQYLLDNNGSLPIVSNVEYHFLPGEYHIRANITLKYLHNFTITGISSYKVSPAVLFIDVQAHIEIGNSVNVIISNVVFKAYDKQYEFYRVPSMCNVMLNVCLSCTITNVAFLDYEFCGINLSGKSYLSNISMKFSSHFYTGIYVYYPTTDHCNRCTLVMNRIFIHGKGDCISDINYSKAAISIQLPPNSMLLIINNSQFNNLGQQVIYVSHSCKTLTKIIITNCKFENNKHIYYAVISLSTCRGTVIITNCKFLRNQAQYMISLTHFEFPILKFYYLNITHCGFVANKGTVIYLHPLNEDLVCYASFKDIYIHDNSEGSVMNIRMCNVNISGYLDIFYNYARVDHILMSIDSGNIWFNGLVDISFVPGFKDIITFGFSHVIFDGEVIISDAVVENTIMEFHSSNVLFNGLVSISDNMADDTVVKFQYSNVVFNASITFSNNQASIMQTHVCNVTFDGRLIFMTITASLQNVILLLNFSFLTSFLANIYLLLQIFASESLF